MKKTMFITSVIMVIVMAIALTTSSLAWFTAGGATNVTTSAMNVKATAGSVEGIAISSNKTTWETSIALNSTGNTGLNPLVPFGKTTAYTPGTLTGDELAAEKTRVTNALIEALVGGTEAVYEEASNDNYGTNTTPATYGAYMIGNKIDVNGNYTDNVYRDGFYTDTFYLKNTGVGSSSHNILVSVDINFKCDTKVVENAGTVNETVTNAVDTYNKTNRNSWADGDNWYDRDATLCVAVLARKAEFFANDSDIYAYQQAPSAYTAYDDSALTVVQKWEIIGYAESKGSTENLSFGKTAAGFKPEMPASSSVYDLPSTIFELASNTEVLRPERAYADTTLAADIKTIKVVAWFEGGSLTNSNNASLQDRTIYFDLQFNKLQQGS